MKPVALALGLAFLVVPGTARGQHVSFNFTGEPGNQPSSAPSFVGLGVTASSLSRGSGLVAAAQNDSINATGWTNVAAIDTNDYYTFSLSSATTSLTLTSLQIQGNRNGNGPRILELRDSLTGFANAGVIQPLSNAALTTINFNLSGRPALQNIPIGTSVELRLYAYDAGNNVNGEFFLDSVGGIPAIAVNPVPEPTTVLAAASATWGLVWGIRRRRRAGPVT